MSSVITIADVTWLTLEGHALFTDLNLSFAAELAGLVGRNGVGKTTLLKLIAGEVTPFSGKVSVSSTLGILRQTIQVGKEETIADLFGVADEYAILRRAESGEASVEELSETDWTLEGRILSALAKLGLDARPETRLAHLSGGQRTRAALAALVFGEPDFLLLDEPTNNLDREGREAVISFLSKWRAGCVVVSHDRELLECMDAIVEITSLGATRYGGNWSAYREQKAQELAAARNDFAHAEKRISEIERSTQATAERKARKDSAGARMKLTGGIPRIGLGLRKQRSEETSGDNARIAEKRRTQAAEAEASARERIEILQPFTVEVPPTGLPSGKTVLTIERATAGYVQSAPVLREFSLEITGPERVAITGPNGSGKTTLLQLVTGKLQPWSGSMRVHVETAFLDQRAELLDPALSIRDNFLRMHPQQDENACRASLARFMFRADAALQVVGTLSGGQLLRAALACVLGGTRPPQLLILDEPTNHLDIDSIEAIEGGLRGYDGALLVVSHDEAFIGEIGVTRRVELQLVR
ncbi:MAG: ABC-F family ATP-binding cassette domain-containing protein [Verrucomicrobiaceae bacterium]|nr:MAG: ABC-F family ATP-binding cassette domain-containing protein [Verrucomicrobiaceae bacterium]